MLGLLLSGDEPALAVTLGLDSRVERGGALAHSSRAQADGPILRVKPEDDGVMGLSYRISFDSGRLELTKAAAFQAFKHEKARCGGYIAAGFHAL